MKVSKEAKAELLSWMGNMAEGDCVRICMGEAVITNSLGCEINRFNIE